MPFPPTIVETAMLCATRESPFSTNVEIVLASEVLELREQVRVLSLRIQELESSVTLGSQPSGFDPDAS